MKIVILPLIIKDRRHWSFYRIHQPYGYIKNVLGKDIFIYDPAVHDLERLSNEIAQAAIVICHLPVTESHHKLIRAIMSLTDKKRKIVVDIDDDLFNVPPWNPAYKRYGTKEINTQYTNKEQVADLMAVLPEEAKRLVQINPDGSANVAMWKDKTHGFDIETNQLNLNRLQSIIKEVDLLTVPTSQLADKLRKYRPEGKIAVLPNLIDLNRYRPMNKKNDGKLRIVWQGGASHYQDLVMVKLELISFAKKHPEIEYLFKGVNYPGLFHELGDRVKWVFGHPDIYAYPLSLSELSGDIAICPLIDDDFNNGKSPLKWEEMSAMKLPCVCSPIVYGNYIEHGKTGFIAREGEWGTYLEELLDPKKREQVGQNAYDHVKKNFSIENASLYWSTLQDLAAEL